MESKRDTLLVVIAVSALLVVAGGLYIWSFSPILGNNFALSPFESSGGIQPQFSPDECGTSCPYNVDILCDLIWECPAD